MENNEILEILNRFAYRNRVDWEYNPDTITDRYFISYDDSSGLMSELNLDLVGAVAIAKHLRNQEILQNYGFNEVEKLVKVIDNLKKENTENKEYIARLEKELSSFRAHAEMVKTAQAEMKQPEFKIHSITKAEEIEFHIGDEVKFLTEDTYRSIGVVKGYDFETKCHKVVFSDNESDFDWIHPDHLILLSNWNKMSNGDRLEGNNESN